MSRTAVVVPLQEGSRERVLELLAKEPPFEPETAGLERYEVFVEDKELVLVLDAHPETVDRIAREAATWLDTAAWQRLAAAAPRVAEEVYSWVRPLSSENVLFEPTPGPGDSEGGDIFPPGRR